MTKINRILRGNRRILAQFNPSGKAKVRIEKLYRVEKIPYPGLTLVQDRHKPSPIEHYPEALMWLSKQTLTGDVFIQRAPTYLILLMLAATGDHVNFLIPHY